LCSINSCQVTNAARPHIFAYHAYLHISLTNAIDFFYDVLGGHRETRWCPTSSRARSICMHMPVLCTRLVFDILFSMLCSLSYPWNAHRLCVSPHAIVRRSNVYSLTCAYLLAPCFEVANILRAPQLPPLKLPPGDGSARDTESQLHRWYTAVAASIHHIVHSNSRFAPSH
jgi:hypothetical protein